MTLLALGLLLTWGRPWEAGAQESGYLEVALCDDLRQPFELTLTVNLVNGQNLYAITPQQLGIPAGKRAVIRYASVGVQLTADGARNPSYHVLAASLLSPYPSRPVIAPPVFPLGPVVRTNGALPQGADRLYLAASELTAFVDAGSRVAVRLDTTRRYLGTGPELQITLTGYLVDA